MSNEHLDRMPSLGSPAPSGIAREECGHELPFHPPRLFRNQHVQTIWPNRLRRHTVGLRLAGRSSTFDLETPDGDAIRVHWSEHAADLSTTDADGSPRASGTPPATSGSDTSPAAGASDTSPAAGGSDSSPAGGGSDAPPTPVLVVLHGLTGCAEADNVLATAAKGFACGLDVVRVDLRNSQGNTPSLGVGHAGRSEDLRAVVDHVRARKPGAPIAVIGFSLGGNIALKAAGEYAAAAPPELRAVAVISVPIDLDDACRAIDRPGNWIYRTYFLRRLGRRYRSKRVAHPGRLPEIDLDGIGSIRAWDNAVVAPLAGFADAEDYYERCSALRVIDRIRVPTLLVQAQDDPFIPFEPFQLPQVRDNLWLELLAPERGGHVGFWSAQPRDGEPDRWWAENRALAFCAAAVGRGWPASRSHRPLVGG